MKFLRWIIIKAVKGIHGAMCRKKAWEKNLQLPALSNLFLGSKLSSLVAQVRVYTESPERKHSQIEFLHLKLLSCTSGKNKKKR